MQKDEKRLRAAKIITLFLILYVIMMFYGKYKPLPAGISYEGEWHEDTYVELLLDQTYEHNGEHVHDHEIFARIEQMIEDADDFLVFDMFLFNDEYDAEHSFPDLSSWLSDRIIEKKQENPEMPMIFITDRINSFYDSRVPAHIERLEEAGVEVIWTDLKPLRDSNPVYSGFWRVALQWFGTPEGGWLPSPFGTNADPVTLRSYFDVLNFKANHRKVVISEREAVVTSANPHDASALHSNIGFLMQGEIVNDLLETERAVAEMSSGGDSSVFDALSYTGDHEAPEIPAGQRTRILTEGKIKEEMLRSLSEADENTEIWVGTFYLSDRDVIAALKDAADAGAQVRFVLDANHDAFGREKIGIPNRPVGTELNNHSERIDVRWYQTHGEQYHTKVMYLTDGTEATIHGGSSNFTGRNLNDLNLETNVMIEAEANDPIMNEIDDYFQQLWHNEEGRFTLDYEEYQEDSTLMHMLYWFQEESGMSSF